VGGCLRESKVFYFGGTRFRETLLKNKAPSSLCVRQEIMSTRNGEPGDMYWKTKGIKKEKERSSETLNPIRDGRGGGHFFRGG